ncbi:ethanolamine ammonia-lyase subunit EutB [Clostridium algidicarnis]|uniref:Ethanolamine ammonia-lyase large subunit n=2 Tax=Clostridium algidicarnis TaxID=37659 RepID=A0A2S6FXH0_9CLOT|nr:ethanolamine ammonia-lyase subunit EutB [Clostridium algidicarnis]MBB6631350.1 ethanolamine ammonia-lyase subunit EutB [Clostridium algidicarnis]MBB6697171.1 ethanolamine ammonia-lyase subunit EutB [Clostridium algidicarnis]MBU3192409.1 ethanolamine ammonia-lyase subunit EutB [Clostridium algidicarnis]MBU3204443.1 ethanolamine ammonia-lyase subunit EutB [Clostridium algidicarnis]MBU3206429.1 ethanolamine ammonia-lyase subunit EutB [Clostridium algidicarnis]
MILKTKLFGKTYQFKDVKEVLAKANEDKSGDKLAGIAAQSAQERVAAKVVLSHLLVSDIRNNPVVPYEMDEITRIIQDAVNEKIYAEIKNWTISDLREWILDENTTGADITRVSRGLTSEVVAAVAKLMSNLDLIYAAKKIKITAHCNTTIGEDGRLSARLQPNHPTDDVDGIVASLLEGLTFGIGDALIGLNPVDDTVGSVVKILKKFEEVKQTYEIPTQNCVLAHVTTQMEAIKQGAPTDLIFQSIAGSQKGNAAFGITADLIEEARQLALTQGTAAGPNVMYFETGQGSELSAEAHFGADQVTMEARCYGFAKKYDPFVVNTVVGFIGPEYLYDSRQVIRAGLEDHFMGKLTGISMGCDVCYTNHMKADQNDVENLAVLLTTAGCNYFMGIPHGDDVMLNYQTTGYHETAALRELLNKRPIAEFEAWLEKWEFIKDGKLTARAGDASVFLKK